MRFYRSRWFAGTKGALKRLNIGAYCALCARPAAHPLDLCAACRQQLRPLEYTDRNACTTLICLGCGFEQACQARIMSTDLPSCGLTTQAPAEVTVATVMGTASNYCAGCAEGQAKLLHRIVAPFRYAYPLDELIKRVKYRDDRQLSRVLGALLAEACIDHCAGEWPDLLIPMPLHPDKLRQRGFNQALDIAYWSGKRLGIGVAKNKVSRIVDTGSMAGLTREERKLRILGAFRADSSLFGQKVAIVDDVLTTGASARELAREIYDCGAASVELWVLARTSSTRNRS